MWSSAPKPRASRTHHLLQSVEQFGAFLPHFSGRVLALEPAESCLKIVDRERRGTNCAASRVAAACVPSLDGTRPAATTTLLATKRLLRLPHGEGLWAAVRFQCSVLRWLKCLGGFFTER